MNKILCSLVKLVCAGVVVAGCVVFITQTGLVGRLFGRYLQKVEPPIRVEFRASAQFWKKPKEFVMRLSNKDAQRGIEFEIVRDGKNDSAYRRYLKPGECDKEFGELEIGSNFVNGDTGYIKVYGYDLVLSYDLSEMDASNRFTYGYERLKERSRGQ